MMAAKRSGTYADQFRDLLLSRGRQRLSERLGELALDDRTHRILDRAGFERVSDLRALLEEHESLRMVPGIGPKREADIRAALELYAEMQLPLNDESVRQSAMMVAVNRAGWDLLNAVELSDDPDWAEDVEGFINRYLAPVDRTDDLGDVERKEAWAMLCAMGRRSRSQ